jgi:uncharacterized protein YjbI with pentapeptide repeats
LSSLTSDTSRACLTWVSLDGANLMDTELRWVDLLGAWLREASMYFTYLTGTKVANEHWAQARSLKGTTLPDGMVHE